MRFVVYGAGAIGGVIGARLFSSGHDVVLIARGAHFEAISAHGLRMETPDGPTVAAVAVVDRPGALEWGHDDVVVIATKSQDTQSVLDALRLAAGPDVAVVCAQNGVENERVALRRFGEVYGMCVMMPAAHLEPGVVQAGSAPTPGILDVGPVWKSAPVASGGAGAGRAPEIAASLTKAGFSSLSVEDIMRWKYAKLLMNLGNAVEALCGRESRGSEISKMSHREGVAVLEAAGIDVVGDAEFIARRGNFITLKPIGDQRWPGDSSWQSLERRTGAIEADYLNGEIVLLGRLAGMATPANVVLQREANLMALEKRPPGTRHPDELLALVEALAAAP